MSPLLSKETLDAIPVLYTFIESVFNNHCSWWNIFTFYYDQYIFISYLLRTLKKCETRQLTTRASQGSSKLEYPHAYITDYRAERCIFYFNIHKYLGAYHYKKIWFKSFMHKHSPIYLNVGESLGWGVVGRNGPVTKFDQWKPKRPEKSRKTVSP